jgi:ABC-2 type transport system permease protein
MKKILLIISREYMTRVRKPTFILMTLLGPILMAAVMIVPVWLAMKEHPFYHVQVIDESGLTDKHKLAPQKEYVDFTYTNSADLTQSKKELSSSKYSMILFISDSIYDKPEAQLFYLKEPNLMLRERLKSSLAQIRLQTLCDLNGINYKSLDSLQKKNGMTLFGNRTNEKGESVKTSADAAMIVGFGSAIIMYIFIILYGVQVMRGVMEEKTSRIVEVIVSSVRPFQLMMGKIIGVAMVGLTQFLLWIILTFTITTITSATVFRDMQNDIPTVQKDATQDYETQRSSKVVQQVEEGQKSKFNSNNLPEVFSGLANLNLPLLLFAFIFYFLGGYLLYSSLFAAVGSAIDSESDSQQFMLPITVPLIFSFLMAQTVMTNPEGALAYWLSIIPFTSPVVMMVRLPFITPGWDLVLSMVMLVLGFIVTTWLAGKIYRTGILMYGKKVSWKELGKWLFYKA